MKKKTIALTAAILFMVTLSTTGYSQVKDSVLYIQNIAGPYTATVQKYAQNLNEKVDKGIEKQLYILYKAEKKFNKRLHNTDSTKSNLLNGVAFNNYKEYANNIGSKAKSLTSNNLNNYIPELDSLQTSLKFLDSKIFSFTFLSPSQVTASPTKATDIPHHIPLQKALYNKLCLLPAEKTV